MTWDRSDEWIIRELARVVRDLPAIDPSTARRLLVELPEDQRAILTDTLAHLGGDSPESFSQ